MTAGNDVVDLSKWDGKVSVNIGDAFSNDNDKVAVMASSLAGTNSNLKLTSIENLEIINAKETKALNLVGENFKGLESIKLKGDATTLNVSGFTYGVKIDATENADNIFGGTKADTINGGAGNDTIQGNQGNDVLTGGNGADTFIVGNAKDFGVDQILDFSAEDKISMDGFAVQELKKFDASTFSTVTYKTLDSVLATFATGGANVTKTGDVVIFSYDGKTYALLSTDAGFKEANDALVDITGANVASLTESNFGEFISQYNYANVAEFNKGATQGLIPANTAIIEAVGSGDEALKTTDIQYIKDGGILSIASGATVSIALQVQGQNGSGETFDANDYVAKFASKTPALNISGTSGNDSIIAPLFGGTINGGSGDDTIDASAAIGAVTIDGGDGSNVIKGGAGSDTINANSGTDSVTGGKGADTITVTNGTTIVQNVGDSAGSVTLAALSSGITAVTVGDKVSGATTGLKVDLSSISTAWTIYQTAAVATKADLTNYATAGFDAFILTDSTNSKGYLVYETDAGNGTTAFGNLEVIEVGADDTFTNLVDNNGILSLSS